MSEGYEIVLWLLLGIATVTDLLWGKIHNALTLPSIALGVGARLYFGGMPSALTALAAIAVAFAFFFPLFAIKTVAAGDAKLLMALGAWSDFTLVLKLGILAILMGAVVGGFVLLRERGLVAASKSVAEHAQTAPGTSKSLTSFHMVFAPAFLVAFMFLKIAELKGWTW